MAYCDLEASQPGEATSEQCNTAHQMPYGDALIAERNLDAVFPIPSKGSRIRAQEG